MADQYGYYGQDGYNLSGDGGQSSGSFTGAHHRGKDYQDQGYSSRDGDGKGRVSRFDPSYQKHPMRQTENQDYHQPPPSSGGHYDYKNHSEPQSDYKPHSRDRDDRNSSSSSREFHQDRPRYDDSSRTPRFNRDDRSGGSYHHSSSKYNDYGSSHSTQEDSVVMEDTIFVSNLPKDVNESDLAEFFSVIGIIKMDKKTRKPKIYIYRDSDGMSKGEATVTYDDVQTAPAAIDWLNGKDFRGSALKIEIAKRKAPAGGFFRGRGRGGGFRGGRGRGGFDRSRDDESSGGHESTSYEGGAIDYRRGGSGGFGSRGGGGGRGGFTPGSGDWKCDGCGNVNFARRFQCNRCQTPKPSSAGSEDSSSNFSSQKFSGYSSDQSSSYQHSDRSHSSYSDAPSHNRFRDGGNSRRGGSGYPSSGHNSDSYGRNDQYSRGYDGGSHN